MGSDAYCLLVYWSNYPSVKNSMNGVKTMSPIFVGYVLYILLCLRISYASQLAHYYLFKSYVPLELCSRFGLICIYPILYNISNEPHAFSSSPECRRRVTQRKSKPTKPFFWARLEGINCFNEHLDWGCGVHAGWAATTLKPASLLLSAHDLGDTWCMHRVSYDTHTISNALTFPSGKCWFSTNLQEWNLSQWSVSAFRACQCCLTSSLSSSLLCESFCRKH